MEELGSSQALRLSPARCDGWLKDSFWIEPAKFSLRTKALDRVALKALLACGSGTYTAGALCCVNLLGHLRPVKFKLRHYRILE